MVTSFDQKSRILIFGGSGFIGLALANRLVGLGYKNVTLADLKPPQSTEKESIPYIWCDLMIEESIIEVYKKVRPKVVFNLAGLAELDKAIEFPKKTMQLNVIGNITLLEASIEYGIELFVYASSAYAMNEKGSFYGISKLTSEKVIEEYYNKYNLNYSILRYGSIYAASDFDNNYLFQLVKTALETKKIIHNGDGEELREYIHVKDVAELTVKVMEDKGLWNSAWMLTGNERMKRNELFEMIREIIGNEELEIHYSGEGDNNHYKLTPYTFQGTSARKIIANPHYDMGQGILECVQKVFESKELK